MSKSGTKSINRNSLCYFFASLNSYLGLYKLRL